ncbi:uncharacterized protein LOC115014685 isoform X2 [Cottoperca gobio]|uniref:Uncharacterized protein LOC115014685 isoform X2 n=1 Tax=Cottoperca gobio TaxID=56716 RepID=A0A6J2QJG0_COTGO|nr:uncharacterized protein LOC115014685 isoform X2 [Cottoperca gobio]
MILLWVTLLFLHQGYTLVPVNTVQLGEPATITCALPKIDHFRRRLHWYKQSAGETLTLIVTLLDSTKPAYAPDFSESILKVNNHDNFSKLTILRTIEEDEGMYHCSIMAWLINPKWSGTYLLLKGNTQRRSNYSVQRPTTSDPVLPGDSMILRCSDLSDSEKKMCSGDHSVFCFRARSDESHPNIIYTDVRRHDECEKRSDTQKSCVYRFSKNFSSSDAGTYYCAVATCEQTASFECIALVIAIVCLVISMIGNIVFICCLTSRACKESVTSQARYDAFSQPGHDITEGGHDLNYSALHFTRRKSTRGIKKKEFKTEESYGQSLHQLLLSDTFLPLNKTSEFSANSLRFR